ncbi:unnamed protein product [Ectocarpus sp. CCAP 1310/34]|nr:unnamed protein product [Ectocarpus sp. CCAP 1310/34]
MEEGVQGVRTSEPPAEICMALFGPASPSCDELASLSTGDQWPQHAKANSDQAGVIPFVTKASSYSICRCSESGHGNRRELYPPHDTAAVERQDELRHGARGEERAIFRQQLLLRHQQLVLHTQQLSAYCALFLTMFRAGILPRP